jgi:hypothetical protein
MYVYLHTANKISAKCVHMHVRAHPFKPAPCVCAVASLALCVCLQLLLLSSIKEACLSRDLLGALMALAAGPLSRAEKMSDEDHQVRNGGL